MWALHHAEFYVSNADSSADALVRRYGFEAVVAHDGEAGLRSLVLRQGRMTLLVTSATAEDHPVAQFVRTHGDGVAGIGVRVPDARSAQRAAVARGATPAVVPETGLWPNGTDITAIHAFGDVVHQFVQLPETEPAPERFRQSASGSHPALDQIDHFAVCVPSGHLEPTARFYESTLGFGAVFADRTELGQQAMNSKVVRSPVGDLTIVLVEPGHTGGPPGQVDDFVKANNGPGVQHIAFTTTDIVRAVEVLRANGIDFLDAPDAYYELMRERLTVDRYGFDDLRRLGILADEDQDGQLFQIFTRSTTERNTYFLEVIERVGATTFGGNNIKALYEAVQLEQLKQDK